MRNKLILIAFSLGLLAGHPAIAESPDRTATIYKNPECGCCEGYADYLRENGFTVTVKPTHDLVTMSRDAGVPEDFQGCHLAFVDNYVISGHVPVNTVNKLLAERPDIKGITLPGMPQGSPGMSGAKDEPFTVYEVGSGTPNVYAVE
jgi:hypothetical protein